MPGSSANAKRKEERIHLPRSLVLGERHWVAVSRQALKGSQGDTGVFEARSPLFLVCSFGGSISRNH